MEASDSSRFDALASSLSGTHDLKLLPSWGPYTKRYMGVSQIPSLPDGFRFDFSAMPGLHRRILALPQVLWESGYRPLASSPDLRYYAHRHDIAGDGRLLCDVEFFNLDASSTAFRCVLKNRRDWSESMSLHLFAWMNFPQMRDYDTTPVQPARPVLPPGSRWIPAMSYYSISFAKPRLTESLAPDGRPHGQCRAHGLCGGEGFRFSDDNSEKLHYSVVLESPLEDAALVMRCRPEGGACAFKVSGDFEGVVEFASGAAFQTAALRAARPLKDGLRISIEKTSGSSAQFDGFALLPSRRASELLFENAPWEPVPETFRPSKNSIVLKYRDVAPHYGLAWDSSGVETLVRRYLCEELDANARRQLNNLVSTELRGSGDGCFTSVALSPAFVAAGADLEICGLLACGERDGVASLMTGFDAKSPALRERMDALRATAFKLSASASGRDYEESVGMMSALTLSQVVYPVNTTGTMIRHSPPGRCWDCLYTWDSGFIGIGLAALDVERAIWNLNAYMNQGESYAAFIHHGTPLPVQHYLFMEIWNRTRSKALLARFYEPLRKFYLLLAGRLPGSTTRDMRSQLIRTWDYFYNSGGWDDYPPQVHVHDMKLEKSVVPAVSTAHLIRVAKFLRGMARRLGLDASVYDEDVAAWSDALKRFSWDAEAGYFSYVLHDAEGCPSGVLRHESGANYDMGMDGASPLISGICDEAQERVLVENLMSSGRMWTDCGISTVDLRAPYYSKSGYWNGAVWLPHQWFFWKTMFDLGRPEDAWRIAHTALELWRREYGRANGAFEHFSVESGRGTGWHHFTGLSCPVLNWFEAYFRPGTFSAGFDVFVERLAFSDSNRRFEAEFEIDGERKGHCACVVAMAPGGPYSVLLDGAKIDFEERLPGVLETRIPIYGARRVVRLSVVLSV